MTIPHHPTMEEQEQFWNWHWQHWRERKTVNTWKDKRHEAVLTYLRSLALDSPTILDLGCGPGWYTEKLAHFGPTVGIDLSKEAISMATAQFPHVTFLAGDLYEVPLPTAHFDVVVSQEVFDHVPDQVAFLDRAADTLKPGGYLIMACVNKFVMDRHGEEFPRQPAAHVAQYVDVKRLKRLLCSHFHVLRIKTFLPIGHHGILRWINSPWLNTVLGYLIPLKYLDALKERAGFGYHLIVLAQKRS